MYVKALERRFLYSGLVARNFNTLPSFPSSLRPNAVKTSSVLCVNGINTHPLAKLDPYPAHFLINWTTLPYRVGMGKGGSGVWLEWGEGQEGELQLNTRESSS